MESWSCAPIGSGSLLVALLAAPAFAFQESPSPHRPGNAAFAQAAVQSLADARDAQNALAGLQAGAALDPASAGLRLRTVYRNAILLLSQAQSRFRPFLDTPAEGMAHAISGFVTAYSVVAQVLEADLSLEERLLDVGEDQSVDSLLADASRHRSMADEAWRTLPEAAARLCGVLVVGSRPSARGEPEVLALTERERSDLVQSIESQFAEERALDETANPPSAATAALSIARFLRAPPGLGTPREGV